MNLTQWGWVLHICISKLTTTGSHNSLLPGWHQAIILTNAGIVNRTPRNNFREILIEIHTFSFKRIHLKRSSGKWRPFCLSLMLTQAMITWLMLTQAMVTWLTHTFKHQQTSMNYMLILRSHRYVFVRFVHILMSQLVEILSHGRQDHTYLTQSILWLLMTKPYKKSVSLPNFKTSCFPKIFQTED